MSNTKNLIILAAVGLGAYLVLTRAGQGSGAIAQRPVGTVGSMPPNAVYGTPKQQQDALNNSTLYGVGRFINGLFSGGSGATAPSGGGTGYTGTREIANDDLPGQAGYGWRYYSDGTSIGPDGSYYKDGVQVWTAAPDSFAINPPGGYEQAAPVDYTNDELVYWN